MKIGVFDSGVGGQSVANAIQKALPDAQIIYRQDKANVPYGSKQPAVLLRLVTPIFTSMVADGCQVIVVACNTVSTTLITELRSRFAVPLVAMEPMVKPATEQTKSGVIAVCATPTTLASQRYQWLKNSYATGITVLEPDCSDWAAMIEHNQLQTTVIAGRLEEILSQGADMVVLGCTHYHWIEQEITRICAGRATIIQPEQAVIAQLRRVIAPII